ncbi:ABC transporter ATP-binding protein [Bosea sp. (in: a-proteobacteria)]|uniref:ABC transporter ATP-binding protein n=1 Tax=Bosea sp. (in: a-proteobacteria) TaxID=1871050 RepID=UPI00261297DC|nr:ABC transporter ATP-binding protein [Bosea sp. (in: a-proteobacteria)]MCO5091224.1 ABC transporter ATP-binding protein [Bosea sp. (in: a-proteobacteria)]
MLKVTSLSASYSGIVALRDVSLSVKAGEMVALIGPNGAGKSTLLNCLSGLVTPHHGSIEFHGRKLARQPAYRIARQGLLQVPEGRRIIGDQSVLENLLLGKLAAADRSREEQLDRVFTLFPILHERQTQIAGSLSGGQQQMLAIGRALMGMPHMMLLDEPGLGLSPVMADRVFEALSTLNRDGLTILLVEQNARRALAATHRTYVLEQGRIAFSGESAELKDDPRVIEHYLGL